MADPHTEEGARTPAKGSTISTDDLNSSTGSTRAIRQRRAWDLGPNTPLSPFRRLTTPARRAWKTSATPIVLSAHSDISLNPTWSHAALSSASARSSSEDVVGWIHSLKAKAKSIISTEAEHEKQFYDDLERDRKLIEEHHEGDSEAFSKLRHILEAQEATSEENDLPGGEKERLEDSDSEEVESIKSQSEEYYYEGGHTESQQESDSNISEEKYPTAYNSDEVSVVDLSDESDESKGEVIHYHSDLLRYEQSTQQISPALQSILATGAEDESVDLSGESNEDPAEIMCVDETSQKVNNSDLDDEDVDSLRYDESQDDNHSERYSEEEQEQSGEDVSDYESQGYYVDEQSLEYVHNHADAELSESNNLFAGANFEMLAAAAMSQIDDKEVNSLQSQPEDKSLSEDLDNVDQSMGSGYGNLEHADHRGHRIAFGIKLGEDAVESVIEPDYDVTNDDQQNSVEESADDVIDVVSALTRDDDGLSEKLNLNEEAVPKSEELSKVNEALRKGRSSAEDEDVVDKEFSPLEVEKGTSSVPLQEEVYYDSENEEYRSPQHSMFGNITANELSLIISDGEKQDDVFQVPRIQESDQEDDVQGLLNENSEVENFLGFDDPPQDPIKEEHEMESEAEEDTSDGPEGHQSFVSFYDGVSIRSSAPVVSFADASRNFVESLTQSSTPQSKAVAPDQNTQQNIPFSMLENRPDLENQIKRPDSSAISLLRGLASKATFGLTKIGNDVLGETPDHFIDDVEASTSQSINMIHSSVESAVASAKAMQTESLGETIDEFTNVVGQGARKIGQSLAQTTEAATVFTDGLLGETNSNEDDILEQAHDDVLENAVEAATQMFETALGETAMDFVTAVDEGVHHAAATPQEELHTVLPDFSHVRDTSLTGDAIPALTESALSSSTPTKGCTANDRSQHGSTMLPQRSNSFENLNLPSTAHSPSFKETVEGYIGGATHKAREAVGNAAGAARDAAEGAAELVFDAVDTLVETPVEVDDNSVNDDLFKETSHNVMTSTATLDNDKTSNFTQAVNKVFAGPDDACIENAGDLDTFLTATASSALKEASELSKAAGKMIDRAFGAPDETVDDTSIQGDLNDALSMAASAVIDEAASLSRAANDMVDDAFGAPDDNVDAVNEGPSMGPASDGKHSFLKRGWGYLRGWSTSKRAKKNDESYEVMSLSSTVNYASEHFSERSKAQSEENHTEDTIQLPVSENTERHSELEHVDNISKTDTAFEKEALNSVEPTLTKTQKSFGSQEITENSSIDDLVIEKRAANELIVDEPTIHDPLAADSNEPPEVNGSELQTEEDRTSQSTARVSTSSKKLKNDLSEHIVMKTRSGRFVGANTDEELVKARLLEEEEQKKLSEIAHGGVDVAPELRDLAITHAFVEYNEVVDPRISTTESIEGGEEIHDESKPPVENTISVNVDENIMDSGATGTGEPIGDKVVGTQDPAEPFRKENVADFLKEEAPTIVLRRSRRSLKRETLSLDRDQEDLNIEDTEEAKATVRRSSRRRAKPKGGANEEDLATDDPVRASSVGKRKKSQGDVKNGKVTKPTQKEKKEPTERKTRRSKTK